MTAQSAIPDQLTTEVRLTVSTFIADEFDLDIEFIEAGGTVEHIIKMTEDNCGTTCQSACTSC